MAGTLTATGRTGQEVSAEILEGTKRLGNAPLSYRANLAQIAIRRLMQPNTRDGYMLTEVVCQSVRDIGIGGQNDSFASWHRGELDVFLDAFGVEPECVRDILDGVKLWNRREVYLRATKIDDRHKTGTKSGVGTGAAGRVRLSAKGGRRK